MFNKLLSTDSKDYSLLILRLFLGAVIFPHGAQKLLGWYGGYGFSGTIGFFTGSLGIPWILAFLVIMAEFFGAIGLITGLLTRVATFGITCVILVASFMIHIHNGFFMNWTGKQAGEGIEYHLLVLGISVILLIKGGGLLSIDGLLTGQKKSS